MFTRFVNMKPPEANVVERFRQSATANDPMVYAQHDALVLLRRETAALDATNNGKQRNYGKI